MSEGEKRSSHRRRTKSRKKGSDQSHTIKRQASSPLSSDLSSSHGPSFSHSSSSTHASTPSLPPHDSLLRPATSPRVPPSPAARSPSQDAPGRALLPHAEHPFDDGHVFSLNDSLSFVSPQLGSPTSSPSDAPFDFMLHASSSSSSSPLSPSPPRSASPSASSRANPPSPAATSLTSAHLAALLSSSSPSSPPLPPSPAALHAASGSKPSSSPNLSAPSHPAFHASPSSLTKRPSIAFIEIGEAGQTLHQQALVVVDEAEQEPTRFCATPPPSLQCALHHGLFHDPVIAGVCGHSFCHACITLHAGHSGACCPVDGRPVSLATLIPNLALVDQINELQIHCKYGLARDPSGALVVDPEGCPAKIKLGHRAEHEQDCNYMPVVCPYCQLASELSNLPSSSTSTSTPTTSTTNNRNSSSSDPNHETLPIDSSSSNSSSSNPSSSSSSTTTTSSSSFWFLKKDLEAHLRECNRVHCAMRVAGCPFLGTLADQAEHERNCSFLAIKPYIAATERRLQAMEHALRSVLSQHSSSASLGHSLSPSGSTSSLTHSHSHTNVLSRSGASFSSLSSSIHASTSPLLHSSSSSSASSTPNRHHSSSFSSGTPSFSSSTSSTYLTSSQQQQQQQHQQHQQQHQQNKEMSLIEVKHRRFEMAFKYLSQTLEETRKELRDTQSELRRLKSLASAQQLPLAAPPMPHLMHASPPIHISPPMPDPLGAQLHHEAGGDRSRPHRQHSHSDVLSQSSGEIKCIDTLDGHEGPVWALASSHDGGFLVSGSSDATVRVWSFTSGKCLHVFRGHEPEAIVHSVAVHRSDKIFSGASDKRIKVWSLRSRECVHTMETRNLVCRLVTAAGRYLISGSFQEISIWDLSTYEQLHTIKGLNHWVRSLVVAPSAVSPGSSVLYAGAHNAVKVFSISAGGADSFECVRTVEGAFSSVYGLEIANNMLFSATFENLIHVLDLSTFRTITQLRGHTGVVYCLCVSNGKLFSGSYDQTIRVWSVDTLRCIAVLRAHTSSVDTIITSIDNRIYSGSADKRIICWQT